MSDSYNVGAHAQEVCDKSDTALSVQIKGSCQSGRKVVARDSKSDLPLVFIKLRST